MTAVVVHPADSRSAASSSVIPRTRHIMSPPPGSTPYFAHGAVLADWGRPVREDRVVYPAVPASTRRASQADAAMIAASTSPRAP